LIKYNKINIYDDDDDNDNNKNNRAEQCAMRQIMENIPFQEFSGT
jgi:hypothetical protein